MFFDLPGRSPEAGQGFIDDLYVLPAAPESDSRSSSSRPSRYRAITRLDSSALVPGTIRAYARFAEPAGWKSYVLWLAGNERW